MTGRRPRFLAAAVAAAGVLAVGTAVLAYVIPLYEQSSHARLEVLRLPSPPPTYFVLDDATLAKLPAAARGVFERAFQDGSAEARIPEADWRAADAILGERDRAATGRTTRTLERGGAYYEYRAQLG